MDTRTYLYVFAGDMLVEVGGGLLRHFDTAIALGQEPGFLGSVIVPPENEVPSLEEAVAKLKSANALAASLR